MSPLAGWVALLRDLGSGQAGARMWDQCRPLPGRRFRSVARYGAEPGSVQSASIFASRWASCSSLPDAVGSPRPPPVPVLLAVAGWTCSQVCARRAQAQAGDPRGRVPPQPGSASTSTALRFVQSQPLSSSGPKTGAC